MSQEVAGICLSGWLEKLYELPDRALSGMPQEEEKIVVGKGDQARIEYPS